MIETVRLPVLCSSQVSYSTVILLKRAKNGSIPSDRLYQSNLKECQWRNALPCLNCKFTLHESHIREWKQGFSVNLCAGVSQKGAQPFIHSLQGKRESWGAVMCWYWHVSRQAVQRGQTNTLGGKKKKKKSHLLGALCTFQFTWQSVECGRKRTGSVARTCRRSGSSSSFQKLRFKPGTWLLTREAPLLSLCFTTTSLSVATESSSAKSSLVYRLLQDGKTATRTLK